MLGTIVNTLAILVGGTLGTTLKNKISTRYNDIMLSSIGITVLLLGLKGALETNDILLVICSMVLGGIIGESLKIEDRLNSLGEFLQSKFKKGNNHFAEGFITASLIYCVGAMAIIGSIESGVNNNHSTLFAKSVLDGVSAIALSSSLGIGVVFAAIPVLLYQGSITLLSSLIADSISMEMLNEISAIGGLLILAIGLNLLKITKIKVANLLPAIFIPVIYFLIKF